MHLVVVTSSVSRKAGGFFLSVRRLTQEIALLNPSVQVHSLQDEFYLEDIHEWKPLFPFCHPIIGMHSYGFSKSLRNALVADDFDISHSHGIWMYPENITAKIAQEKDKPFIVSTRGMLDSWAVNNARWKKRIAGFLYVNKFLRNAACLHALCESEYNSIRAYGLNNPVAIIPNGIDLPEINRELPAPWENRFRGDKEIVLFLGRIHPKKGLLNLIKAWLKLKPADWILVIAGWDQGGHERELKNIVVEAGFDNDIVFLGPVFGEKKLACLQNADAFILPSFSEGLPMSILEAWSYGLPVLKTSMCNIPEGFMANAAVEIRHEQEYIAEGLKGFFTLSAEERNQIGQNGLNLVKQKFTWPRIAARMVDVYKWILGQGNKPDCVRLD